MGFSTVASCAFFAICACLLLAFTTFFVYAIQRRNGGEFLAILPIVFAMQTIALLGHAFLADWRNGDPCLNRPAGG